MAWRFQKRVKIAPGVRVNLSKSGASVTTGVKGLSVNTGKNGTHLNTGIPGTGLSKRTKLGGPTEAEPTRETSRRHSRWPLVFAVASLSFAGAVFALIASL